MNKKIISSLLFSISLFGAVSGAFAASETNISNEIIKPMASKYITVTESYFGYYPDKINYADEDGYQGTLRFVSATSVGGGWWVVKYGGYVSQN